MIFCLIRAPPAMGRATEVPGSLRYAVDHPSGSLKLIVVTWDIAAVEH